MSNNPNSPDEVDTQGKAVPPYEGRRASADMDDKQSTVNDGARVGGASGPVESDGSDDDEGTDNR